MKPVLRAHISLAAQRGSVMLLMVSVITVAASFMLLKAFNAANGNIARDQQAFDTLAQAKDALINYATQPVGTMLGQLPYPDILDTVEEIPPAYASTDFDGNSDPHCPDTSSAIRVSLVQSSRCFGRLPWRTLGMSLPAPSDLDPAGEIPWYAVSANLLDPCNSNKLNPQYLNRTYWLPTYNCLNTTITAHDWLTVRDKHGNVLSNRVAFVLIMPMQKINTQVRNVIGLPRNYLDGVTVASTCTPPCVPGTYSNASYNPGNEFIVGEDRSKVANNDLNYSQPYTFNDKVLYVTIDELMAAMERRALLEARQRLLAFFALKHYFPYAANIGDTNGACVSGSRRGFLPLAQGSCGAGESLGPFPAWFTNASWQNSIYYTLANSCKIGTNNCDGLPTDFLKVGNINFVRAIVIGTGRPVKSVTQVVQVPSMATPPYAASVAIPGRDQTGCCSTLAVDYLDSIENANGDDIYDGVGMPRSNLYNDQMMIVAP